MAERGPATTLPDAATANARRQDEARASAFILGRVGVLARGLQHLALALQRALAAAEWKGRPEDHLRLRSADHGASGSGRGMAGAPTRPTVSDTFKVSDASYDRVAGQGVSGLQRMRPDQGPKRGSLFSPGPVDDDIVLVVVGVEGLPVPRVPRLIRRVHPFSVVREDDLEAVFAAVVEEVAAVCAGVCACDRESESGASALLAAVELFEELLDCVVGDAAAVVGDGDAQVAVLLCGGENDRWCAVGGCVGEQVGDDPFER